MKRLIVLSALLSILAVSGLSQPPDTLWTRTYGGAGTDRAYAIQCTDDGGYVLAGFTCSLSGVEDAYLVKTDSNGDTLWTSSYGGEGYDYAQDVRQTNDGGYIIAGHTSSFGAGSYDMYLVKTDALGHTQWTRSYGGQSEEMACSVRQTPDGGYIVAGHSYSMGPSCDLYLVKTDGIGDTLWTRTYGDEYLDQARCLQLTSDGGYIIAGYTESPPSFNAWLLKLDANGDTLWTRTYGDYFGEPLPCSAYCVQQTADQGYILAGYMIGPCMTSDIYVVKTNSVGDTLWTNLLPESNYSSETAYSVQELGNGDLIIAGVKSPHYHEDDAYLLKFSSSGTLLWSATYGGGYVDVARGIQFTDDGGYIIAGYTYSYGAGEGDFYLIKTGPDGAPVVPPEQGQAFPITYALHPPYPNPFNASTVLRYEVPRSGSIHLTIHNLLGQQVATVIDRAMSAGSYSAIWNAGDLPSGIYFLSMSAAGVQSVQKMVLIK